MAAELPSGLVTLVFTDIAGSTRLLHELGDGYGAVLRDHHRLLRDAWAAYGGVEVDTEGDAFFVAFPSPRRAVEAVAAAQTALDRHPWTHGRAVRARMGVHSGEPQQREGTYWGIDVHYAARLCAAAHGGQVLISAATHGLLPDIDVESLGQHALKDFPAPRSLFHLVVDGRKADAFPPPRTLAVTRNNIPSVTAPLIGRDRELAEIITRLRGGSRLITLIGVGGSGKTRLAIEAGRALIDEFADGVFLSPLASVAEPNRVEAALAAATNAAGSDLRGHIARRSLLLIVDNMEHLLVCGPLLAELLELAPGLKLLVTSQAPLRVRPEEIYPLAALDPDHAGSDLFVERAEAAGYQPKHGDAEAVAEICRRLDGLPLAIELAAARVRVGGPHGVLAALKRGVDALGTGSRDLPERQRGLRAALEWTIGLISQEQRRLFAALGAFGEAWTLEQLEAMLGDQLDTWEATAGLLDFSLISERGDGRYTFGEAVRTYAREQLVAGSEKEFMRRRHAELVAGEADEIHAQFLLDWVAAVARARDLRAEIAAAAGWAGAHDPALHRRLLACVGAPLFHSGELARYAEAINMLADQEGKRTPDAFSWRVYGSVAWVRLSRGDGVGAAAASLTAYELTEDPVDRIHAAVIAATVNEWGDDPGRGLEILDNAIPIAQENADRRLLAACEAERAAILATLDRYEEAEPLLASIVADATRTDFGSASAASYWADCALMLGRYDDALDRYARYLGQLPTLVSFDALLQSHYIAAALAGLHRDEAATELECGLAVHEDFANATGGTLALDERVTALLAAARERLDCDALASAEARGRAHGGDMESLATMALREARAVESSRTT
jgi:predicted ATPase/class 3 adenylate cyclase